MSTNSPMPPTTEGSTGPRPPVRRGLTAVAAQYEWSSAKMYLNGEVDSDGAFVSRERSLNRRTS